MGELRGYAFRRSSWLAGRIRLFAARRPYVASHPFFMTIGAGAFLASLILLALPGAEADSALAMLFPRWIEILWLVLYAIAGVLIVTAVWTTRPDIELAGCLILGWVLAVDAYALLVERGVGSVLVNSIIATTSIGAFARAVFLAVVYPKPPPPPPNT